MTESKLDLYVWQHRFVNEQDQIIARTCFGITGNRDRRQNHYEGHVGHTIEFCRVWSGPARLIRQIEDKIKRDFHDYLVVGHRNYRYEWITEEIELDTVLNYIQWEVDQLEGIVLIG